MFTGIAALLGLLLGPLIDRIGAKSIFVGSLFAMGLLYLFIASSLSFWQSTSFLLIVLALHSLVTQGCFISFIALHMSICWDKVSATQFAIYMAWSNLARSIGASLYGEVKPALGQGQEFYIMAAMAITAAGLLLIVKLNNHNKQIKKLNDDINQDMVGPII